MTSASNKNRFRMQLCKALENCTTFMNQLINIQINFANYSEKGNNMCSLSSSVNDALRTIINWQLSWKECKALVWSRDSVKITFNLLNEVETRRNAFHEHFTVSLLIKISRDRERPCNTSWLRASRRFFEAHYSFRVEALSSGSAKVMNLTVPQFKVAIVICSCDVDLKEIKKAISATCTVHRTSFWSIKEFPLNFGPINCDGSRE